MTDADLAQRAWEEWLNGIEDINKSHIARRYLLPNPKAAFLAGRASLAADLQAAQTRADEAETKWANKATRHAAQKARHRHTEGCMRRASPADPRGDGLCTCTAEDIRCAILNGILPPYTPPKGKEARALAAPEAPVPEFPDQAQGRRG